MPATTWTIELDGERRAVTTERLGMGTKVLVDGSLVAEVRRPRVPGLISAVSALRSREIPFKLGRHSCAVHIHLLRPPELSVDQVPVTAAATTRDMAGAHAKEIGLVSALLVGAGALLFALGRTSDWRVLAGAVPAWIAGLVASGLGGLGLLCAAWYWVRSRRSAQN